jgi:hypothetical protein
MRLFVVIVLTCLLVQFNTTVALAKGGYTVTSVTVRGETFPAGNTVAVDLPEGYDEMGELHMMSIDRMSTLPGLPEGYEVLEPRGGEDAQRFPYDVTLHYDLERLGKREWNGKFDGKDLLYFPDAMYAEGGWIPGWYRASPLLAEALQRAAGKPSELPAGGDNLISSISNMAMIGFGLISLGLLGLRIRLYLERRY